MGKCSKKKLIIKFTYISKLRKNKQNVKFSQILSKN